MFTTNTVTVDGVDIFYRRAGDPCKTTLLLLHGFPTSSHQFRQLMSELEEDYHLIAPDFLGFGFSACPNRSEFSYTFGSLARIALGLLDQLHICDFHLYVFDYGAPVGWRIAMQNPERILSIVSQNGNAYEEGLSEAWKPVVQYWEGPTSQNRDQLRFLLTPDTTKWQYMHGEPDTNLIAPEAYTLDSALLGRPGNVDIQLDLILDYQSNIRMYPKVQQYFRTHRPLTCSA